MNNKRSIWSNYQPGIKWKMRGCRLVGLPSVLVGGTAACLLFNLFFLQPGSALQTPDTLGAQQVSSNKKKMGQSLSRHINTHFSGNMALYSLMLTLLMIATLFYSYRSKKLHNRRLRDQKEEINIKNMRLEKLVSEKDWLLKEINHRVKNNLQLIISLLHSQSFFMRDPNALVALRDSQHRVHSISLVHKKLYHDGQIAMINMPEYLLELLSYLKDSFSVRQQILFEVSVDEITLDSSQAVPLGLILNEAVTNSIKYAFPGERKGLIKVLLNSKKTGGFKLSITDNGIGIPENFEELAKPSLGISLIKGLALDLNGIYKIENSGGTVITIEFPDAVPHQSPVDKTVFLPKTP